VTVVNRLLQPICNVISLDGVCSACLSATLVSSPIQPICLVHGNPLKQTTPLTTEVGFQPTSMCRDSGLIPLRWLGSPR